MLRVSDFPQLKLLAWNRGEAAIDEAEALALYERNWRFVDQAAMQPHERQLIDRLVQQCGNGVFLV